ncbi:MAG: glycoside hydrolase family 2 TIM barrel-domain containing protein [Lentisphaeria bacterium]
MQPQKQTFDLSSLPWRVAGFVPHEWELQNSMEIGAAPAAEIPSVPAPVPGSVQQALRQAGVLPDWNLGLDARSCEWVENRHWLYETRLPDAWFASGAGAAYRLRCLGLDYAGVVRLNGQAVGTFANSLMPHVFDLGPAVRPANNILQIVFECPPRWLGQFGYTSRMREPKPRFNYFWDWTSRLVQAGIWDAITLEVAESATLAGVWVKSDYDPGTGQGALRVSGNWHGEAAAGRVRVCLEGAGGVLVRQAEVPAVAFRDGALAWEGLAVAPWWPNGQGAQPLYTVRTTLFGADGGVLDEDVRQVGFKHVEWRTNLGAPAGADPWLCVVNGRPLFLQGVNWTPIRPNFADLTADDYRQRLDTYKELGINLLRVWGGGFLEPEHFFRQCDERGLLVWQEFPLSSSGVDNWPPEDSEFIAGFAEIARHYVERCRHHACLLMWCGGNELQGTLDGGKQGCGKPVGLDHPLMQRLQALVAELDPGRRFVPSSSSGPRFMANAADFGRGLHWDVHGPWKPEGTLAEWAAYWEQDDALFRSETGAPGASPLDILERYRGDGDPWPPAHANPLWRRAPWWVENDRFQAEHDGRAPADLAEYVAWSQARQAEALVIAARACKRRFPACGGFLVWMGHDSFPCTANTAILDFEGRPKPAALRLAEDVFRVPS